MERENEVGSTKVLITPEEEAQVLNRNKGNTPSILWGLFAFAVIVLCLVLLFSSDSDKSGSHSSSTVYASVSSSGSGADSTETHTRMVVNGREVINLTHDGFVSDNAPDWGDNDLHIRHSYQQKLQKKWGFNPDITNFSNSGLCLRSNFYQKKPEETNLNPMLECTYPQYDWVF